jgi:hypothetical protein
VSITKKGICVVSAFTTVVAPWSYRAKQVSMPQPGRCQGFGGAITQIVVFRAIELKSLLPVQLAF